MTAALYTRLPSSALRLTGPDRLDFLQGQMTNHLKAAPTPGMVPACFLNPKGQIELFARIYKRVGDVYLHLWEGEAAQLAGRFKKYIIFDDVQVQDVSSELATVHLWSEHLPGWQAEGSDVQDVELGGALLAARVQRSGQMGLDVHYLKQHEAQVLAAIAGQERSLSELEAARIAAGVPDVTQDRWAGYLPQEVGLESALSYRKGCYVGQEIMARLEARGNTRYALQGLQAAVATENEVAGAAALPPYSDVVQGGKVVGRTGASSHGLTLARLRKDLDLHTGAPLEVGARAARLRSL